MTTPKPRRPRPLWLRLPAFEHTYVSIHCNTHDGEDFVYLSTPGAGGGVTVEFLRRFAKGAAVAADWLESRRAPKKGGR